VLEDADIAAAAKLACAARLKNSGQVCINAKRFIVSEAIYDAFKEELI
jgi:succinate-semialdehyde dehydrogenase/glutarate-semialdehyde dehydrogenase